MFFISIFKITFMPVFSYYAEGAIQIVQSLFILCAFSDDFDLWGLLAQKTVQVITTVS